MAKRDGLQLFVFLVLVVQVSALNQGKGQELRWCSLNVVLRKEMV
jgi:hypothetical protein